jgi:uncharacterized protein (DUF2147 family)
MIRNVFVTIGMALSVASGIAVAQVSPVGLWKTIDDKTKAEQALVRISESAGVLSGRVERFLAADIDPGSVCEQCRDDRKGRPILGLEIIRDVKRASTSGRWDGGTILDSEEGKIYRVRLEPIEGGQRLEVRGYIGMSLFGRTQTWVRVE